MQMSEKKPVKCRQDGRTDRVTSQWWGSEREVLMSHVDCMKILI